MPWGGDDSAAASNVDSTWTGAGQSAVPGPAQLHVLDAASPADRAIWLRAWQTWPDREVFAHPAYVQLFAREQDRVCCAWLEQPAGGILFPFLLRPLAGESWADPHEPSWDLTSPYGYGGPFAWKDGAEYGAHFWNALDGWLAQHQVVSAVVRLSLFGDQRLPFPGDVEPVLPNVVRSLDLDAAALWRDYEHKVRKNVQRARADQLTVEFDESGQQLAEFLNVYYATMDRRGATDAYYFPRSFFEALCEQLAGQYLFCHVRRGANVVSSELVLVSNRRLYSFLGGTLPEAFPSRPNDLLKHEVIAWGQRAGKQAFVLGGGYQGEDGIFRYKKSFAPRGAEWFCLGKRILTPESYHRLVQTRQSWHQQHGAPWEPRTGYFPAYRG